MASPPAAPGFTLAASNPVPTSSRAPVQTVPAPAATTETPGRVAMMTPVPGPSAAEPVGSPPARAVTAPPRLSAGNTILAQIMSGISVPAAELDVAPLPKPAPPSIEIVTRPEPKPAAPAGKKPPVEVATAAKPEARRVAAKPQLDETDAAKPKKGEPPVKKSEVAKKDETSAKKSEAAAKKGEVPAKKGKAEPAKAEPSRVWVQVAGGANKADLPKAWRGLVAKAPGSFRGRQAWTTPLRFTNRLLTGPFKSQGEALAFVNELSKAGLSGFAFTSPAGQAVERLPL